MKQPYSEQIAKFPGKYTPTSDGLIQEFGLITAAVYGKIWRYCQARDKVCRAKVTTLAEELGVSGKTVERSIKVLEEAGYIYDKTPALRNRPHLYYCTDKALPTAKNATQTDIESDQTNPDRHRVLPSQTYSRTQTDTESDEDSIEDSIEESKESHSFEPNQNRQVKTESDTTTDLAEVVSRLSKQTGYYFSISDPKTLEVARFIAEHEQAGERLETFLEHADPKRVAKYPSFPLDICKEWKPVFDDLNPQYTGVLEFGKPPEEEEPQEERQTVTTTEDKEPEKPVVSTRESVEEYLIRLWGKEEAIKIIRKYSPNYQWQNT